MRNKLTVKHTHLITLSHQAQTHYLPKVPLQNGLTLIVIEWGFKRWERVVALITSIIFGTTWLNLVIEPKLLYLFFFFFFFFVSQISLEATIFLQLIIVVGHEW